MMRTLALLSAASLLAMAPAGQAAADSAVFSPQTEDALSNQHSRIVELQVLLDRARHSPGVIDGVMGVNTERAIKAYQRFIGMAATGRVDPRLMQRLRQDHGRPVLQVYRITQEDVGQPYSSVPATMTGKAKLDRVAFADVAEMVAEKFHMARSLLESLNPGADLGKAGTTIRVVWPGSDQNLSQVDRIEVDKSANELRAYSGHGSVLATYPTTVGSNVHPSPNDTLKVLSIVPNPTYYFDPTARTWGPDEKLTIAPGPNNPVGVVWIDLSRDGYGIHGTPEPKLIGKTSSHGCVRLTNWDARELSRAVKPGTAVQFT